MLKKIYSSLLLLVFCSSFIPPASFAQEDTYFIVTAYYSPLPDQEHYLKGNYEDEITLNGKGIAGASGKKVFSGMLAAPWKYKFGTKVYLEWLWVGAVEDRGWAIVEAGKRGYEHDRIDVWMGYGDEGLKRALYWGKRKVKWSVVSSDSTVTLSNTSIASPEWATRGLSPIPSVFSSGIGIHSESKLVKELQEFLHGTGHYTGEIDGVYNSTLIDVIADFQEKNGIETSLAETGYWGGETKKVFLKQYLRGDFASSTTKEIVKQEKTEEETLAEKLKIFDAPISDITSIKKLQTILTELEIYTGEIDGLYSSIKDNILEYQIEEGIILTKSDTGAGYFGPKTRNDLKENYTNYIESIKRKKELEVAFEKWSKQADKEARWELILIGDPVYGDMSSGVRRLQINLKKIWYADYSDTAIFGAKTENSILDFQKDVGLIQNGTDAWAGKFGPKTQEAFVKKLAELILIEKLKEENLFEDIQAMTDLLKKKDTLISDSLVEQISIQKL